MTEEEYKDPLDPDSRAKVDALVDQVAKLTTKELIVLGRAMEVEYGISLPGKDSKK